MQRLDSVYGCAILKKTSTLKFALAQYQKLMANFIITISCNVPYPKSYEFREQASNFGPAISRAIRKLRKGTGRKKILDLTIKAIKVYEPKI